MTKINSLLRTTFAGAALLAAVPSQAAVTTFAQFQATDSSANLYWKNTAGNNVDGTGGSIFTIAAPGDTTAGSVGVKFSFLQPSLAAYFSNADALFTLNASVASTAAQTLFGFVVQPGIAGTFSFLSTGPVTIGSTTYLSGANLLSGTFDTGTTFGQRTGTSGSFSSSLTNGAMITYTSDFLDFTSSTGLDFAVSLTSITNPLDAKPFNSSPTKALRSFRANSTGSFSSNPAPVVTAVPEPQVWGLMLAGFAMIGLQARRRKVTLSVAV